MDIGLIERINDAVTKRQDFVIGLIQELVRIPTYVPPGLNYDLAVQTIAPYLEHSGFKVRRIDVPPRVVRNRTTRYHPNLEGPRANLLAYREVSSAARNILWYAHLDTVPVDSREWIYNPFGGDIVDGRIWGRGAADDKGAVACITAAFHILAEIGITPNCNSTIAFGTDEEIGAYTGLMYLSDRGFFRHCQVFHCCDGNNDAIYVAFNGSLFWRIRAQGKSIHSSMSLLGVNPIERSVPLLGDLLELKQKVQARRGAAPGPPGFSALHPLLNVTIANAGLKHNIVPPELILEGDRRFLPEEDEEEVTHELQEVVDLANSRDPELKLELSTIPVYVSWEGDTNAPWTLELKRAAEAAVGHSLEFHGATGSCDVSYVARNSNIPMACFGLGRMGESNRHGANENVRIEDAIGLVRTVCLLAAGAV